MGPRYDNTQTDQERNGFDNLILLCPNHHSVIDNDEKAYTADRLLKMKLDHESKYADELFNIDDTQANKFITNIKITLSTETSINYSTNSQIAQIIQNINPTFNPSFHESYIDILENIHSGKDTLSKNLVTALRIAKVNLDDELTNLCISELSGWDFNNIPKKRYRFCNVYLSPYKISKVINLTMTEFWAEIKSKPDKFIPKEIFFSNSVPDIEYNIEHNQSVDPLKAYIHLVQNYGDLLPGISNLDREINLYCLGTLYHDLLEGVKNNFTEELLKRIK